ncbi:tyrosine-protein phosphatase [Streptomyces sp. NPDC021096]|uniref:tyrosine-protein phosphatase n=1 Tax=Streptomyces sp. NPDC021096 TaxID=3154792 RepID=UPI0033CE950C
MPAHTSAFRTSRRISRRGALAGIGAAVLGIAVSRVPAAHAVDFPPGDPHNRFVDVDGAFNIRDVGGWNASGGTIAPRVFYRGGALGWVSDAGLTQLSALKLAVNVNFLSRGEMEKSKPDRLPKGVRTISAPVEHPGGSNSHSGGIDASKPDPAVLAKFRDYVTLKEAHVSFGLAVREIAALGGRPFYLHCSSGTYRTGWATAVLMTILGVDRDQVNEEFLLSNLAFGATYAWTEYLDTAFEQIGESFGSFDGYLAKGLGVSDADRGRLRKALTA